MKEDILSVPELPTHTASSEIFKVLMVSLKREVSNGKTTLEFVLTALPVLQVEIQVQLLKLRIWREITYCQRTATFIGKIRPPKKMAPELNEVLSQSVKNINYIKKRVL